MYVDIKAHWGVEKYISFCSTKERLGLACWRLGIWRLKNRRNGIAQGYCPICNEREDSIHILLECRESSQWGTLLIDDKYRKINKEIAYKKLARTTDITTVKRLGQYLFKVKKLWESFTN